MGMQVVTLSVHCLARSCLYLWWLALTCDHFDGLKFVKD